MSREICKTAYTFEELSDSAKETARDWYRSCIDSNDFDATIEDVVTIAELMGIEIEQRQRTNSYGFKGQTPSVWWSVSGCQGDGACFDGAYRYSKGSVKAVKDYAPQDKELHRIVEGLMKIQKENLYQLVASVKQSGHYNHAGCTNIDVERYDGKEMTTDAEDTVAELLRDFMNWIYEQLQTEAEWLTSDEQIDENILANDYEFYASGERV